MEALPIRITDLSDAELDALIDDVITSLARVIAIVCPTSIPKSFTRTPGGYVDVWLTTAECIARHELPPPHMLGRIAGYALTELSWRAKARALTPDEELAKHAASRMWRATDPKLYPQGDCHAR